MDNVHKIYNRTLQHILVLEKRKHFIGYTFLEKHAIVSEAYVICTVLLYILICTC